jgi:signal transduction histidine kinase
MNAGSLRLRLLLIYAILVSLALTAAGLGIHVVFQRHAESLMLDEFQTHFEQLAGKLSIAEDGKLTVDTELSDPRFSKQFGGRYWQVDVQGQDPLRSRSLWDEALVVSTPPKKGEEDYIHELPGPNGTDLLSLERLIEVEKANGGTIQAVVTIGMDRASVSNATSSFSRDMQLGLAILYVSLLCASVAITSFGLKPLQAIRLALAGVHTGEAKRLDGEFAVEIQPLVSEINTLLEDREKQVERARHRAGNLAHGLKTPLTVLDAIAGDLAEDGKAEAAADIRDAKADMQQIVERELMRARLAANQKLASTQLLPIVTRVCSALKKSSRGQVQRFAVDIPRDAAAPIDEGDLNEMVGNLLENAAKYCTSMVAASYRNGVFAVEDDGPGVPDAELATITSRGVKLDQHKRGSGLGLAIVQDMADAYGHTLAFRRSDLGGLRAEFRFKGLKPTDTAVAPKPSDKKDQSETSIFPQPTLH